MIAQAKEPRGFRGFNVFHSGTLSETLFDVPWKGVLQAGLYSGAATPQAHQPSSAAWFIKGALPNGTELHAGDDFSNSRIKICPCALWRAAWHGFTSKTWHWPILSPDLSQKPGSSTFELRRCHLVALLFCWSCVQKVLQDVCFGLDCLRVMQLWSSGCHFLGY